MSNRYRITNDRLTEVYATSENGVIYLRRDIDSECRVCGPADFCRERETGVPAYVGWQVRLPGMSTREAVLFTLHEILGDNIPPRVFRAVLRMSGILQMEAAA